MPREEALAYWFAPAHEVFVADTGGEILGTYYLRENQSAGADVANCGYMTAPAAAGRGVARAMCTHSIARAKEREFSAMRFNFVVATNEARCACGKTSVSRPLNGCPAPSGIRSSAQSMP
jgi:RimJ/RimL family protein N-acetyltransferase